MDEVEEVETGLKTRFSWAARHCEKFIVGDIEFSLARMPRENGQMKWKVKIKAPPNTKITRVYEHISRFDNAGNK